MYVNTKFTLKIFHENNTNASKNVTLNPMSPLFIF